MFRVVIQCHSVNSSQWWSAPCLLPLPEARSPPKADVRVVLDARIVDVHHADPELVGRRLGPLGGAGDDRDDSPYSQAFATAPPATDSATMSLTRLNCPVSMSGPRLTSSRHGSPTVSSFARRAGSSA